MRHVVSRLREEPPDLRSAVDTVAAHLPRPAVHVDIPDGLDIPSAQVRDAVVRSVQEALVNSVRHSGAANVSVIVRRSGGGSGPGLVAEVVDDGVGAAEVSPGNGLTGMRERVEALGGTVVVDGTGGADGFRVTIEVPDVAAAERARGAASEVLQ